MFKGLAHNMSARFYCQLNFVDRTDYESKRFFILPHATVNGCVIAVHARSVVTMDEDCINPDYR